MSSSTSSDSDPRWIHDVFLSFRGDDTRTDFISHLESALSNAGINTFIDYELKKGLEMRPELYRAIEGSRISLVVLSVNYAESTWCLRELEKIMECRSTTGQLVIPVFYHVEPSDVRHLKGAFGKGFEDLAQRYSQIKMTDEVSRWKRNLAEAANISGWDVRSFGSESKMVKEIVNDLLKRLNDTCLSITDFPVGLESHVQDVIQFLEGASSKVCIVGIWGMGGSGKTTIAKAIYNQIHLKFEDKSFLEDIREVCENHRGKIDLQEQLLWDILKTKVMIHSIALGTTMIEKRLCGRKMFIVLDDVTKFDQLTALCGNRKWIGLGSVIIVTTRDVCILNVLKVDYVHRVKEMDENESLELFSWHAFKEASPREGFIELSGNVVAYCGGLPLALEVLGSCLYERTQEEWKGVLSKLETIPNDQVHDKLRISFDGLNDHTEKDIFLDICCFFIGKDRAYVTQILNGCGFHASIGITVLIERSLIKVEKNNKLGMHNLIRDMGRAIVRESAPDEPEKHSRLWFHEDVLDVLMENTGTKAVEGLALKLQRANSVRFKTNAFKQMKRLRLLQLDHVELAGDYGCLSKQLRWVYWKGFSLKYTPTNLDQGNLVAIDFKYSNLRQVWGKPQLLLGLKVLNLSHARYLKKTPDFQYLPNLEKLILKDCPSLSKIDQSIGHLNKLLMINLKDCTNLSNLPRITYKLKSMKTLIISGCSKIDKLEEDIVQMESLTTLIAKNTAIKQVPFSIARSKSIGYISLCGYEGLSRDIFPSLIWSWMSPATNPLSFLHRFRGMLSSLVSMDVKNNNSGDLSPMLSGLSKLRSIWVRCNSEIQLTQELRRILAELYDVNLAELETTSYASPQQESSLNSLLIGMGSYHQVANIVSKSISQGLTTSRSGDFVLPGDNHPYWLTQIGEGHSILFEVPQVSGSRMKGMTLCVIYSSTLENVAAVRLLSVLIVNYTKCVIQLYKRDTVISLNDEEWHGIMSNLGPGDKVEIFAVFGDGLIVKRTAIYLIYGEDIDRKMKPSLEPKNNPFIRLIKRVRMPKT